MNYANMIEEKHLKKGFIVATLISTIVGTFTASMTLHDKIQEKRAKQKQVALDGKQSGEIQQLQEELKQLKTGGKSAVGKRQGNDKVDDKNSQRAKSSSTTSRSRSSSGSSRRRRRRQDSFYENDAAVLAYQAGRSRALIEQTYEDNFRRMGPRYASGDLVAENMLQAQIIQLQQTVIDVLQDALYNNRSMTEDDLRRLVNAQDAARDGSIEALQAQYDRMSREKVRPNAPNTERSWDVTIVPADKAPPPLPTITTQAIGPSSVTEPQSPLVKSPLQRRKCLPAPPPLQEELFCKYSEQLQSGPWPLHSAFAPAGSHRCPSCHIRIPVDTRDVWVFSTFTSTGTGSDSGSSRDYSMSARFVAKSHMRDGRFACVLCARHRERDCICRDVDSLVKHMRNVHTRKEFEGDVDIVRMKEGSVASLSGHEKQLVLA